MVVGGGEVGGEAGERPRHVGRTAGDEEPRGAQTGAGSPALLVLGRDHAWRPLMQWVGVEEVASVGSRRGRHDVVQGALVEIREARFAVASNSRQASIIEAMPAHVSE